MDIFEIVNKIGNILYTILPIILICYLYYSKKVISKYVRRADEILRRIESLESNQQDILKYLQNKENYKTPDL